MSSSLSSLLQLGGIKVALLLHRVGICCAVKSSIWLPITRWRVRSPKCFMSVNKRCTNLLPCQLLEQVCVFLGKQWGLWWGSSETDKLNMGNSRLAQKLFTDMCLLFFFRSSRTESSQGSWWNVGCYRGICKTKISTAFTDN